MYGRLVGQWAVEMNHVTALIGGLESRQRHAGQAGVRFMPVGTARQQEALAFLHTHALDTPEFLIDPAVLRRIEVTGVLARIEAAQGRVLDSLLDSGRMTRLVEQHALDGAAAYAPTAFLADLRQGLWRELDRGQVDIDAYRRNVQRRYLATLHRKLNGDRPVANDERAFVRGELRALAVSLAGAPDRAVNRETRFHVEDAIDQIARALDPKFATPTPRAGPNEAARLTTVTTNVGVTDPSDPRAPLRCWPDYAIGTPGLP